ncbi:MAG: hypothetical protein M0030_21300 [Actinomycetota bacterium]|nr:hypothetical protein [Actinomycetota bacterium]
MTTGTESERERDKRHYQRALFDGIAGRYEASRPGCPPHVVEFVTATGGLGPRLRSWKSAAGPACSPSGWHTPGSG